MQSPARTQPDPRQNKLLAALRQPEWDHWEPHLELVPLALGQVLCESGSEPTHAYFPTTAIVSLVILTEEGQSAEIAIVGNDGLVGIALFMGGHGTIHRAVVQSAGLGYRLPASLIRDEARRAGECLNVLMRYTLAMLAQVAQTAACNRYHSIDQLLCRRLLLGLDRLPTDDMMMTQELAASLLGVRREGITAAAHKLQQAGVIRYSRGRIAVLDRGRLEERTCERMSVAARPRPAAPVRELAVA